MLAEDTLFGDAKLIDGFGRSVPGLRKRGLVDGEMPHVYLTPKAIDTLALIRAAA